jgi:hypothetical protein
MKALIITQTTELFFTLPLEAQREVWEATVAYIYKCREAGMCKEIYLASGSAMRTVVGIWEFQSPEELDRVFLENPVLPFMDVETLILSDWDAYVEAARKRLEELVKK